MRTVAVIPLRGLADGKSRLAHFLPDRVRRALIGALLERVVHATQATAGITTTLVISPDPAIVRWAETLHATPVLQTNTGLNAALWQATNWAREGGYDTLLALHGDLPLITPRSLRALLATLSDIPGGPEGDASTAVVVGDRHRRGTTGLLLRPLGALPFLFGEESFGRHLACGAARSVRTIPYDATALAFDLDTPRDLATLATRHPRAFLRLCRAVQCWLPQVPHTQPLPAIAQPIGEKRP
jgi:2-phospho-L-lactate guanylyltransferase